MERRSNLVAVFGAALAGAVLVYGASSVLNPYLLSIIAFLGIGECFGRGDSAVLEADSGQARRRPETNCRR